MRVVSSEDIMLTIVQTNKGGSMAARKKRAPGGGRKPRGDIHGKSATLSTRITHETRLALETEANLSGQSISQIAERMIVLGLDVRHERSQDNPVQALCYVIGQLSQLICNQPGMDLTDPFFWRACALAIQNFMDNAAPEGEARPPADLQEGRRSAFAGPIDTPEARAKWALTVFGAAWDAPPVEAKQRRRDEPLDWAIEVALVIGRDSRLMSRAKAALTPKGG
jgi:hypothetical protein